MKLQARRMWNRSLVGVYSRAMNRRTKECAPYQPSPIFMFRLLSVLGLILPSNSGKKEAAGGCDSRDSRGGDLDVTF
jgi:hypothetical protein